MSNTFSLHQLDTHESFDLDKGDWFKICQSENYRVFKMSEWSREDLVRYIRKVTCVSPFTSDMNTIDAGILADRLFAWAGDYDIVMTCEGDEDEVFEQFGYYYDENERMFTSRYDLVYTDFDLTEGEVADREAFQREAAQEHLAMTQAMLKAHPAPGRSWISNVLGAIIRLSNRIP
jgi:hypothetical protein